MEKVIYVDIDEEEAFTEEELLDRCNEMEDDNAFYSFDEFLEYNFTISEVFSLKESDKDDIHNQYREALQERYFEQYRAMKLHC